MLEDAIKKCKATFDDDNTAPIDRSKALLRIIDYDLDISIDDLSRVTGIMKGPVRDRLFGHYKRKASEALRKVIDAGDIPAIKAYFVYRFPVKLQNEQLVLALEMTSKDYVESAAKALKELKNVKA